MAIGTAELGVVDTEIGAVDADKRLVLEADMGVYGDARV
jgi:chemotaxis methyl-accepting protein methylase